MSAKLFKFMICVIMCAGIAVFWARESYCDTINQPHIEIKGKILTADGQPIAGARLRLERAGSSSTHVMAPFVVGLPSDTMMTAVATESGAGGSPATYLTSSTGDYDIILKFAPGGTSKQTTPQIDVSTLRIDKSKMVWEKGGYIIKSK